MSTEQNNWVIPDRCGVMKRNAVTVLVLTVLENDIEYCAKSIILVVFGLQGPVDCELVSSRATRTFLKAVSLCQVSSSQVAMYFTLQCTNQYKAWGGNQPEDALRHSLFRDL